MVGNHNQDNHQGGVYSPVIKGGYQVVTPGTPNEPSRSSGTWGTATPSTSSSAAPLPQPPAQGRR